MILEYLRSYICLFVMLSITQSGISENGNKIEKIFHKFNVSLKKDVLEDYGGIYKSSNKYWEIIPKNISEIQKIVKIAYEKDIALRIRGRGHGMNGASLPRQNELLIRTNNLNHYVFRETGFIVVGAGAPIWDVKKVVERQGLLLPVHNGGGSAPSVGGYLVAGGIGDGTEKYGGFWENVEEITIINGKGQIIKCNSKDEMFPWMFGSLGQLGIVVEVKLKLANPRRVSYPLGKSGVIEFTQRSHWYDLQKAHKRRMILYWYGIFVPIRQEFKARFLLHQFMKKYAHFYDFKLVSRNLIRLKSRHPPLLYPINENIVSLEIRAMVEMENKMDAEKMVLFEKEFMKFVLENGYRRFPQVEFTNPNMDYKKYFGDEIYNEFQIWKKKMDPKSILNKGLFLKDELEK